MLFSVMFRPHTKCVEYANVVTYLVNIAVFEKCQLFSNQLYMGPIFCFSCWYNNVE